MQTNFEYMLSNNDNNVFIYKNRKIIYKPYNKNIF